MLAGDSSHRAFEILGQLVHLEPQKERNPATSVPQAAVATGSSRAVSTPLSCMIMSFAMCEVSRISNDKSASVYESVGWMRGP
jgi:hypothetical protein